MKLLMIEGEKMDEIQAKYRGMMGKGQSTRSAWIAAPPVLHELRAAMTEVDEDTLEDIVEDWACERDEVGSADVQPFAPYLLAHMEVK